MAARISSCCEYRYAPGFQQGRGSCFRLAWLSGGMPCYRCTSVRNKSSSCQQLNHGAEDNFRELPLDQTPSNGDVGLCPSSPLFIPVKPEKAARPRRKQKKEDSSRSTDSQASAAVRHDRKPKRHRGPSGHRDESKESERGPGSQRSGEPSESEGPVSPVQKLQSRQKKPKKAKNPQKDHQESNNTVMVSDSLQDEEALSKQNGKKERDLGSNEKSRTGERRRDFYEECVEMSAGLDLSPNKQHLFKANILERRRLQKRLSSGPNATSSDVEPSEESDSPLEPDTHPEERTTEDKPGDVPEQDLQTQLNAMMTVLNGSDEVEQLVLRNTGLTDELLQSLALGLKASPSEVTLLNLNLNHVGPYGSLVLLDLLRAKPQVRALLLFGNQLGDSGVLTLLSGLAELQTQETIQPDQGMTSHPEFSSLLASGVSVYNFVLLELDLGGNGLSSDGLKVLASYMRHYSQLQYLGLAQTRAGDLEAWAELFQSIKGNASLHHIILDESDLGDVGVRLFADMLMVNWNLRKVDLDCNGISDVGGGDLLTALLCRGQAAVHHLSLERNQVSDGLMSLIQQEVTCL
ncbi:uncharacterized protein LOC134012319 [Osmerus eperlanus]|uniref:uncharacterized protein LOC134012319 n=1 Tax=Osmerus eperlanus TaxID=29151 RepID=UPI002E146804